MRTTVRGDGVAQWPATETPSRAGKWHVHLNFWPGGPYHAASKNRRRDGLYDSAEEARVHIEFWRDWYETPANAGGRRPKSEGAQHDDGGGGAMGLVPMLDEEDGGDAMGLVPMGAPAGGVRSSRKARRTETLRNDAQSWTASIAPMIKSAWHKLSGAGRRAIKRFARGRGVARQEHRNERRDAELAEVGAGKLGAAKVWRREQFDRLSTAVNNGSAVSLLVGYDRELTVDGIYSERQQLRVLRQAIVCFEYLQVVDERHFSVAESIGRSTRATRRR